MNIFTSDDEIELRMKELNTKFANSKIGVVGNVYCLQEGISINQVDGIIMIDPRSSGSAIIQILGRPVRLDSKNPNKVAKIILPIIFKTYRGKIELDKTYFDTTRDWMLSIVAADSDFENMVFNDINCITTKSRKGIEVKNVKVSNNKKSVSGVNRNVDKDEIELEKVDFTDYKDFAQLKSMISTKTNNTIQRNTKVGKNEYLIRHARTMVIGLEKKLDNAIQNYNVKQFSRYTSLITDRDTIVTEFANSIPISKQSANKILTEVKVDRVIKKIAKLNKLNYSNVLNLI
jgi:predicted helicase